MTNLPNPIYHNGDCCQRECDLFCGTETDADCRLGFAGEDGTCNAAEAIAELVQISRRRCDGCRYWGESPARLEGWGYCSGNATSMRAGDCCRLGWKERRG